MSITADPVVTPEHIRELETSRAMEPVLMWYLDTDTIEVVSRVMLSDVSLSPEERARPRMLIVSRQGGRWERITDADCREAATRANNNRRARIGGRSPWLLDAIEMWPERFAPLTTVEAAARWGVDPATVRQQIANGRIAATKAGRDWLISRAEVERYRREHLGRPGRRAAAD